MDKIKLLIVDDHHILVEGLKNLFDQTDHIHVIGTAASGTACRKALNHELPDVILLDISLPDANGIELCKEIKTVHPQIKIVALSSFNEYAIVQRMMDQGASGYVVKNAIPEEIVQSVEMVMQNETYLCEEIDHLMYRRFTQPIWLTRREKELLSLIVEGYTNVEIAEKMFLGVETINSYRKNLLVKTGARNTAVLVRMAIEQKLV